MTLAVAVLLAVPTIPAAGGGQSTAAAATAQPLFPIRATFYYPWFPKAWTQRSHTPSGDSCGFTLNHPEPFGDRRTVCYSSSDSALIARHLATMKRAGIQAGIASWWGRRSREDLVIPKLLAADNRGFKWSLYYEQEGIAANGKGPNPSVAQIRSDLEYMAAKYFSDPDYLRVGGRPVVFVFNANDRSCAIVDKWRQANSVGAYIVLKVFSGYRKCATQPSSWHQYAPSSAVDRQAGYSYAISPGFHLTGSTARLTRDLARWRQNVRDMVASREPWHLITTFNEWGENSSVENAREWRSASGHGGYLDALAANVGSSASPTTPPPPRPTPSPTRPRAAGQIL